MKHASRAVHAGRGGKAGMGARAPLAPDLSPAAVHVYSELDDYDAVARGERPGHYYGRNSNSNRAMLEKAVAELEGAEAGVATGSGMAAIHVAILALAPKPVTILATRELYLVPGHETRIALRSRNVLGSRGPDPGFSGFEYPLAPRELFLEIAHMY